MPESFRRAATAVERLLKGTKPEEWSAAPPTQCDLVINLKTAQALSLTIPPTCLIQAHEVIQ